MAGARSQAGRVLVSSVGGGLLTALMASCRSKLVAGHEVQREIVDSRLPAIYVLWHGRLLPCAYHYRHHGFGTLISRNRDGEYIAAMIRRWGFHVIRGSSSRGATSAQREIVRVLGQGRAVALTPDGPRGPRQKMKIGPIRAAARAGVPLVPVSAGAASAWYFGSWDRFLVPRPFTRIAVALGDPIVVPSDPDPADVADVARHLEEKLNDLTRIVDEIARG